MRRFVSIVFLLLCSLGPLSALLPGSESQLPACCRRHGAHHCMMAAAEQPGRGHSVSAPSRCAQYHRGCPAPAGVYTPSTGLGIAHAIEAAAIPAESQTVALRRAWTEGNRGPPALL